MLSIHAPPSPLGTSTILRLWRNAFRIVLQKCSAPGTMRRSSCRVSFSPHRVRGGISVSPPLQGHYGGKTLFLIATGPHVSVNTIIGLPFMQGTGMILDLVDNSRSASISTVQPSRLIIDARRIMFLSRTNQVPPLRSPNRRRSLKKLQISSAITRPRCRPAARMGTRGNSQYTLAQSHRLTPS